MNRDSWIACTCMNPKLPLIVVPISVGRDQRAGCWSPSRPDSMTCSVSAPLSGDGGQSPVARSVRLSWELERERR
ncbi:MAG: hypothetical protein R3F37_22550 [Candidatus Competibacteraceae bacterium]